MSKNSGTVSGAFSERIKQLRKAKGASQAQVAEYLGVTRAGIQPLRNRKA